MGLPSGLLLRYSMAPASISGTAITDVSGNGNTGTLGGSPTAGTSPQGSLSSLTFNGSNQYIKTASNLTIGTDICTVCFWMYKTAFTNTDLMACELSVNTNSNNNSFYVDPNAGSNTAGLFQALLRGVSPNFVQCFDRPTASTWHHYAIVFDGSTNAGSMTIYIDNSSPPTGLTTTLSNKVTHANFGSYTLYLMSRAGTTLFNPGSLSEFQIYNRGLSGAEVTQVYTYTGASGLLMRRRRAMTGAGAFQKDPTGKLWVPDKRIAA